MNVRRKIGFALLLCTVLALTACGNNTPKDGENPSASPSAAVNPTAKIGEIEVVPGETALGSLLDNGFSAEVQMGTAEEGTADWKTTPVSSGMSLTENTIYRNIYLMKDGVKQARVDVSTGAAGTLSDAVISCVTFSLNVKPTEYITFGGIALSVLTQDAFTGLFTEPVILDGSTGAVYSGTQYSAEARWDDSGALLSLVLKAAG